MAKGPGIPKPITRIGSADHGRRRTLPVFAPAEAAKRLFCEE
jgi:hypothetical protein